MEKIVLAISGGIDSVVLLHMIANDIDGVRSRLFLNSSWPGDFVMAHFNHGIRGVEANRDEAFVKTLGDKYGVGVVVGHGRLGSDCSEEQARRSRYDFLFKVAGDNGIVVLAHHTDDLIETAVMNLIRGTGWRGLAPMSQNQTARPLLSWTKTDITQYAIEHNLSWVEDSTNDSMSYFRNRIRGIIGVWTRNEKERFLRLIAKQISLRHQIDSEIAGYINRYVKSAGDSLVIRRYSLIMLPNDVAIEILKRLTESKLTTDQLWQLLVFIKSAKPAKKIVWKTVNAIVSQGSVTLYFRGVDSAK